MSTPCGAVMGPVVARSRRRSYHRTDARSRPLLEPQSHHRGGGEQRRAHVRGAPPRLRARSDDGKLRTAGRAVRCGLVDWRERSIKALDTALDWLLDFLTPAGGLVVWVDPQEPTANRKLRAMLEKHGLIIEAGTVREHGSAVLAQRSDMKAMPKVA